MFFFLTLRNGKPVALKLYIRKLLIRVVQYISFSEFFFYICGIFAVTNNFIISGPCLKASKAIHE